MTCHILQLLQQLLQKGPRSLRLDILSLCSWCLQVGLLRHPFSHPDCFSEGFSDLNIENRSYVLPMPLSSQLSSRIYPGKRYLIEAGCSDFYSGSLEWFVGEAWLRYMSSTMVSPPGWSARNLLKAAFPPTCLGIL